MSQPLRWPPRGSFGYKPLVSAYEYDPRKLIEDRSYFGLPIEGALHYGTVKDDEGHLYSLTRRFSDPAKGGHDTLIVQSTRNDDGCLHFEPNWFKPAATGKRVVSGMEGDHAFRRPPSDADGKPYELLYGPDSLSWWEEDLLKFEGRLCGPGLQWYLPQPNEGIFYASSMFQIEGELAGRRVRGFMCADTVYMTEGGMLYGKGDPMAGDHTHVVWYTWGTRFKDGSFEGGHFSAGHDNWGFALTTTDKEEVTTCTNVEAIVKAGSDGNFPESIHLRAGDTLWEFIPHPKGRMPDFLGKSQPSTPQQEGRWRRVGDTREPDIYWAWGEINPASGLERKLRFRS